ncbi:MAG: hypothetical protein ABSB32_22215 [Thermodesulfobacteriota bacterium]
MIFIEEGIAPEKILTIIFSDVPIASPDKKISLSLRGMFSVS